MSVSCYAAMAPKSTLEPFSYKQKPLGPHDVEIEITHCGICHSDIHLIDNDWGISQYPLVPGHEIIGMIKAVGSEVDNFKHGQRVGVGWEINACGTCEWCMCGKENQCSKQEATCVGHHGGFATSICANSRFVFPIPAALTSENAAPLLCGGVTVYSPIKQYVTSPNMRVGVIGIGGLGHLALQFAKAHGCEVTAFSTSPNKISEAKKLGADNFVDINDKSALVKLANTHDFILSTVTAPIDWTAFINVLRPNGTLCIVGAAAKDINISIMSLISGRKSVCGSNIGSCPEIIEMLDFAAKHNIKAETELMKLQDVNAAIDKVRHNQARYRMVLEI